jgi:hypothetical protein
MVDTLGVFVNLPDTMTGKTRNWLAALLILAFPFLVFLAFLIYELNRAPPTDKSLPGANSRNDSTNAVPPIPAAGTNLTYTSEP